MAKKRQKNEQLEIELKQEYLSFQHPVQHVVEGVSVSRADWFELTGEVTQSPVRLLRLVNEPTQDELNAQRIGTVVSQIQGMMPDDREYTVEIARNTVAITNENGVAVARVDDVDFDWNDEAGMWEHLRDEFAAFLRGIDKHH